MQPFFGSKIRPIILQMSATHCLQGIKKDKQHNDQVRHMLWHGHAPAFNDGAGAGDLGCQLHVVACLLVWSSVGAQRDHAPSEARQVAHLVLQETSLPLRYVGQTATGLTDQVLLYVLGGRGRKSF